jgi:pentatricopeptide repeat protein
LSLLPIVFSTYANKGDDLDFWWHLKQRQLIYETHIALLNLGKYREAIEAGKSAIYLDPHNAEAYNNMAAAYGRLGLYEEAIVVLKKVLRYAPDYADAYYNLGVAYFLLGNFKEASSIIKSYRT